MKNVNEFGFGTPMLHHAPLNTWSSSLFTKVDGYTISFAGDDGNNGKLGEKSIRHYLMITDPNELDITESLGFKSYDVTFDDFLKAINKVKEI